MNKFFILATFVLGLLILPGIGRTQDVPPYLFVTDVAVSAANAPTSSVTTTVDLTTALGLTESALNTQLALGNIYFRIQVQSDGTVDGSANFRFSSSSGGSAAGTTTATTGVLIQEGGLAYVQADARYLHFAGFGTDATHTISVVRCKPFNPN